MVLTQYSDSSCKQQIFTILTGKKFRAKNQVKTSTALNHTMFKEFNLKFIILSFLKIYKFKIL
jgi:hypothetical protein